MPKKRKPIPNSTKIEVPHKRRIETPSKVARILIKDINPGDRIRSGLGEETPEQWKEFKESLTERGQITPITVMEYENPFGGLKYFLLAGERRLRALKELDQKEINVAIYPPDLSADEIIAIELRENLDRTDFTPEQEAKGIQKFHEACVTLYGQRKKGQSTSEGHSLEDTARMLGKSKAKVSEAISAAKVFNAIPELGKHVKKWSDLKRISYEAERQVERDQRKQVMKKADQNATSTQIRNLIADWYIVNDSVVGLKELDSESIDLVEFDPHYPIEENERITTTKTFQEAKTRKSYKATDREQFPTIFKANVSEAHRVLRPDGWLIIWFGYEFFWEIQKWLFEARFIPTQPVEGKGAPLFFHGKWYKEGFGHSNNPFDTLGHSIEPFFYVKKSGKARLNKPHSDVFKKAPNHWKKKVNPFEKPVGLYEEILCTFVPEESFIVSSCVGSGNILLACANYNCVGKGFDLSEQFKEDYVLNVHNEVPPNYGKKGE